MESTLTARGRTGTLTARWSVDPGSLAAWLLPAGLVTYLGLRSGGYDTVVSDQVAVAIWWLVFLILALRIVPLRLTWAARLGLGLLVAYAAWTTLSVIWTESAERTMGDITLVLLYVPLALLAFSIRGRDAMRLMLDGLACAIVAIAAVALLSRLHFAWFSVPEVARNLPENKRKLAYPIGYWNALAALVAMGIPLLLHSATGARQLIWRALAAGAVPALVLCAFLTVSRGGAIAVLLGVVAFVALAPDRLWKIAVCAVCAGASALVVAAANQRTAVRDGMRTPLAAHQGSELIAILVVAMVAVALIAYAIALVDRHVERPRWTRPSRGRTTVLFGACAALAVAGFLAAGGGGFLHREWTQFKTRGGPVSIGNGNALQRLQNVTGDGRYQYWQAAARAADAHPLTGTGAGTFVYWWARDGTLTGGYVQDAHSLYMQSLGELGYPGLILIVAFIGWILVCGVARVLRTREHDVRLALAAATAGAAVFAFSAAVEWIWLIPVLPATLLMLAAVIFAPSDAAAGAGEARAGEPGGGGRLRIAAGLGGALVALGAIVVIALPLSATAAVRSSQASARTGDLASALTSAREAVRLQPYASSPWLQEALVLELGGNLRAARADAQHAVSNDPYSSDTWLVLSRLQARTGNARAALADYLRAKSLNPHSLIFQ